MRKTDCRMLAAVLLLSGVAFASSQAEKNKAIARRVFTEILSQGKYEAADEIYATDFVNHGLTRDASLKEDEAGARGWRQAAPDLVVTVEQMVAEGDRVAVVWTGRGTNTGAGMGLPATGKKVQVRGLTLFRIVDSKIREEWSAWDQLSLLRQAGLIPAVQR